MKREQGSVSIVVAAIILLALVLSLGVADVARVLVARSHARTAADAAALAVAQELALPSGMAPADAAADYAVRNDAILTDCVCAVGTRRNGTVSIVVDGFLLVTGPRTVTARARAVVDRRANHLPHSQFVAMDLPPGLKVGPYPSREPLWDEGTERTYRAGERRDCSVRSFRSPLPDRRRLPTAVPQRPRRTSAPEHPADRERRPGVVDVLA